MTADQISELFLELIHEYYPSNIWSLRYQSKRGRISEYGLYWFGTKVQDICFEDRDDKSYEKCRKNLMAWMEAGYALRYINMI